MQLRKLLTDLVRIIADEADHNPEFSLRLANALGLSEKIAPLRSLGSAQERSRPKNRRPSAVLDPVELARSGAQELRVRLSQLSLEQLKDIVADYGMDPGKLVMKWKDPERIIERIAEISVARAQKGDAFRLPSE